MCVNYMYMYTMEALKTVTIFQRNKVSCLERDSNPQYPACMASTLPTKPSRQDPTGVMYMYMYMPWMKLCCVVFIALPSCCVELSCDKQRNTPSDFCVRIYYIPWVMYQSHEPAILRAHETSIKRTYVADKTE